MFTSARLQLTAWYLAIIMLISISFSVGVYKLLTAEFDRIEHMQRYRVSRVLQVSPGVLEQVDMPQPFDKTIIEETKVRIIWMLIIIDGTILGLSSIAGYFLAGRTLRPIREMVDEQHRFITDASHELRTPLTSLRSEIEVNLRNKNLALTEAKKLLASNLEEVVTLQALSDNLLELAQNGRSHNQTHFVSFPLSKSIDSAVNKLHGIIKRKHIVIEKHVEESTVFGIQDRITELFVILLDNAIKYSGTKATVTITTKKVKDKVVISFIDTGYGIEAEDLPHIFDRFFRASKSRSKENVSGYGLGLSIAKKIVETHDGTIVVKSKPNAGSTFVVSLPAK